MAIDPIPVSAIVATRDRPSSFSQTLDSLLLQEVLPRELIVIDASTGLETRELVDHWGTRVKPDCSVFWENARETGAAVQRNQAIATVTQPFVWFFDDDILFGSECVIRLWHALQSDARLGGVNAMIVNQRYESPSLVSRLLFRLMHGRREQRFAGRVIGPAINLLPEDREDLPEVIPVEWLNTTCTLYRREALPSPPFDSIFTGYSMMEDLALSLVVARSWNLANARTARIYHDTQPAEYKSRDILAKMELMNRHYIMTRILKRTSVADYIRLFIWELFQLATCSARGRTRRELPEMLRGKCDAWWSIFTDAIRHS